MLDRCDTIQNAQDIALSFWSSIFSRSQCSNSFLIAWIRHNYCCFKVNAFSCWEELIYVCCFYFFPEKTISPCPDGIKIIWNTKVKKIWVMIMEHIVLAALPWKMKFLNLFGLTQLRQKLLIFWNWKKANPRHFSL